MSKDKYPRIFLRLMETTMFIILLQRLFATREVLKIGKYYYSPDIPQF